MFQGLFLKTIFLLAMTGVGGCASSSHHYDNDLSDEDSAQVAADKRAMVQQMQTGMNAMSDQLRRNGAGTSRTGATYPSGTGSSTGATSGKCRSPEVVCSRSEAGCAEYLQRPLCRR